MGSWGMIHSLCHILLFSSSYIRCQRQHPSSSCFDFMYPLQKRKFPPLYLFICYTHAHTHMDAHAYSFVNNVFLQIVWCLILFNFLVCLYIKRCFAAVCISALLKYLTTADLAFEAESCFKL